MVPRLFKPWLLTNKNVFFLKNRPSPRAIAIIILGLLVCCLIFLGSYRVLSYFHAQNELGIILSLKILQMIWITLFAMLIFSGMVTGVSTLYLSKDNEIILAAPLQPQEIYLMRYFSTSINTSWMVLVFSLPLFTAYGLVFSSGILFWPLLVFSLVMVALTASALAMLLTIAVVYLFPAKQTKDIILYLSLCFGLFLYLLFRLMRPETLVNPDQYGQFIEYFSAISAPAGPWLPAGWAANLLTSYLLDRHVDLLLLSLISTTPFVLYFAGEIAMNRLFMTGFSKSQESFGGHRRFKACTSSGSTLIWIFRKELKQFTRDSSEWSQLFMIVALIIVYLFNFKALPLDRSPMPTEYISNLIGFANIGLAGFLAASLATRFVYPCIGSERGAFYLIKGAPLSLQQFLWCKYLFYLTPFTLFTLILIIASNHLLQISGTLWWISLFIALVTTWTILGLALGFGAYFADFKAENKSAAMGPGAILFLFAATLYQLTILTLGVIPTYRTVKSSLGDYDLPMTDLFALTAWLGGTVILSIFLLFLAFRWGINKLTVR